ncbi:hypothetical protein JCM8547_003658 [Rhodosporidiobolus lusitaniae]
MVFKPDVITISDSEQESNGSSIEFVPPKPSTNSEAAILPERLPSLSLYSSESEEDGAVEATNANAVPGSSTAAARGFAGARKSVRQAAPALGVGGGGGEVGSRRTRGHGGLRNMLPDDVRRAQRKAGGRAAATSKAEGAGKAELERKATKKDHPLHDLPYPFELAVRLEEIRLLRSHLPPAPFLRVAVAFREVATPALDATPAVSHDPAEDGDNQLVTLDTSDLPPTPPLRLHRSPLPPTVYPNPPPDLREILFHITITAADVQPSPLASSSTSSSFSSPSANPQPERLVGSLSLSKGNFLRRKGYGKALLKAGKLEQTSGTAMGTMKSEGAVLGEVGISWEVVVPKKRAREEEKESEGAIAMDEDGNWEEGENEKGDLEEAVRAFVLDEMRRFEKKWKLEMVERETFLNDLDASDIPLPPPVLLPDPTASKPSSLIPGLESSNPLTPAHTAAASTRFASAPAYSAFTYTARGLPDDPGRLKSFPFLTKSWMDDEKTKAIAEELQKHLMEYLDEFVAEDPEEDRLHRYAGKNEEGKEKTREEMKDDYRRDMEGRYLDEEVLFAVDTGRIERDFSVLKNLFSYLRLTPIMLNQIEADTLAKAVEKAGKEGKRLGVFKDFVFMQYGTGQDELVVALGVFEEGTGVSAWLAQERLASAPPELSNHPADPLEVDTYDIRATSKPARSDSLLGTCPHCRRRNCKSYLAGEDETMLEFHSTDDELIALMLEPGMPQIDPCTASLLLDHPIKEGELFGHPNRVETPPAEQPNKKKSNKPLEIAKPQDSLGYEPPSSVPGLR